MGTQVYQLQIYKERPNKSIRFGYKEGMANEIYELLDEELNEDEQYTSFYEQTGCREFILDSIEPTFADGFPYFTAIRCFGEQYHTVSSKIRAVIGGSKIISEFMSKIFSMELEISSGAVGKKAKPSANPFAGEGILKMSGKKKKVNGYVTLYYTVPKRHDKSNVLFLAYSSILALLREPRIVSGILNKTILSKEDLIKGLLKIAEDRFNEKDRSYNCWVLPGSTDMSQIQRELTYSFNGDGSDYASIASLAFFIMAYSDDSITKEAPEMDDINGPVTYFDQYISQEDKEKIFMEVRKWGIDFSFVGSRRNDSYRNIVDAVRVFYNQEIGSQEDEREDEETIDDYYDDDTEW